MYKSDFNIFCNTRTDFTLLSVWDESKIWFWDAILAKKIRIQFLNMKLYKTRKFLFTRYVAWPEVEFEGVLRKN